MIRTIFKIKFQLASGLSVGTGGSLETDSDVLKRRDGAPFIPGSSIAGVYRETLRKQSGLNSPEDEPEEMRDYFGFVKINRSVGEGEKDSSVSSRIMVYDANVDGPYVISERDNVALDEMKTAIPRAKFDREIVNAGTGFVTYFEESIKEDQEDLFRIKENDPGISGFARQILRAWFSGEFRFGSKTTRGLGTVSVLEISMRSFRLPKDADSWVDFDMYGEDTQWRILEKNQLERNPTEEEEDGKKQSKEEMIRIRLELRQNGGISIRQYSTEAGAADFMQLENTDPSRPTGNSIDRSVPIIPGSSWTGAIRHRMKNFLPDHEAGKRMEWLFGHVDLKTGLKEKSRIIFSESRIENPVRLTMTRNAIDRFTGGTVDGALYTERVVYNGTCELLIEIPKQTDCVLKKALAAALADLHEGFLAVGGETAVGRGLFQITTINGVELHFSDEEHEGEKVYKKLLSVMGIGEA